MTKAVGRRLRAGPPSTAPAAASQGRDHLVGSVAVAGAHVDAVPPQGCGAGSCCGPSPRATLLLGTIITWPSMVRSRVSRQLVLDDAALDAVHRRPSRRASRVRVEVQGHARQQVAQHALQREADHRRSGAPSRPAAGRCPSPAPASGPRRPAPATGAPAGCPRAGRAPATRGLASPPPAASPTPTSARASTPSQKTSQACTCVGWAASHWSAAGQRRISQAPGRVISSTRAGLTRWCRKPPRPGVSGLVRRGGRGHAGRHGEDQQERQDLDDRGQVAVHGNSFRPGSSSWPWRARAAVGSTACSSASRAARVVSSSPGS